MSYKIYVSGNIFYIVDNSNSVQYEGLAKDCLHRRSLTSSSDFSFVGLYDFDRSNNYIEYADIQDKNGDPMSNTYPTAQDFSDYLDTVLGNSSGGGNGFDGVVLDEQTISNGGSLTIPSSIAQFSYLRFEINGAGAANVSVDGIVKSDFRGSCRVALHHDDATGYIYFDTNATGTVATLTASGSFSGNMTARVVGLI